MLNHTGEGDDRGPDAVAARARQRARYYRLRRRPAHYVDDAGCGNTLALDRPPVLRLAMDALRHWALARGRRRLPLRPRARRSAGGTTASTRDAPLLQAIAQDPGAARPEAHRRALGHRARRLPLGGFPPAGASGTTATATTSAASGAATRGIVGRRRDALAGSADVFAARAPAVASRQLRHRARRLHAGRPGLLRRASTTTPTARATATAPTPTTRGTTASRAPTRDAAVSRAPRARRARRCSRRCCSRAARRCSRWATSSGRTPARQQQRLRAGQRADLARLGRRRRGPAPLHVAAWSRCAARIRALRATTAGSSGAPPATTGIPDVQWRLADGQPIAAADWHDADARALIAVLYVPARDAPPPTGSSSPSMPVTGRCRWRCLSRAPDGAGACASTPRSRRRRVTRSSATPTGLSTLRRDRCCSLRRSLRRPARRARGRPTRRCSRGSPRPPVSARTGGTLAERATRSATIPSARCSPRWACRWRRPTTLGRTSPRSRDAQDRRALPAAAVVAANAPAQASLTLTAASVRARGPLRLTLADGDRDRVAPARRAHRASGHHGGRRPAGRRRRCSTFPRCPRAASAARRGPAGVRLRADRRAAAAATGHEPLAAGGRRFGLALQLYALRRADDGGIGDFTTLARTRREAAARRRLRPSASTRCTRCSPADRERASPYQPSDRRFLDPSTSTSPRSPSSRPARRRGPRMRATRRRSRALAAGAARRLRRRRALKRRDPRRLLRRLRAPRPGATRGSRVRVASSPPAATRCAHFAAFEAISAQHPGRAVAALARRVARARRRRRSPRSPREHARDGPPPRSTCNGSPTRQLAAAAQRARDAGLALGLLPRPRRRRRAGRRRDLGARSGCSPRGASIGAPPDPFSPHGPGLGPAAADPARDCARRPTPASAALLAREHAPRGRRCASTT